MKFNKLYKKFKLNSYISFVTKFLNTNIIIQMYHVKNQGCYTTQSGNSGNSGKLRETLGI